MDGGATSRIHLGPSSPLPPLRSPCAWPLTPNCSVANRSDYEGTRQLPGVNLCDSLKKSIALCQTIMVIKKDLKQVEELYKLYVWPSIINQRSSQQWPCPSPAASSPLTGKPFVMVTAPVTVHHLLCGTRSATTDLYCCALVLKKVAVADKVVCSVKKNRYTHRFIMWMFWCSLN